VKIAANGLLMVLLGLLVGCRHVPVKDTGRSAVNFVEPPPAPAAKNVEASTSEPTSRTQYNEARPIKPLAMPVYPPKALAGRAGWNTVGVKFTVGVDGRVTNIRPSILAMSTRGRFAEDFQAAVEAALRQWKFAPAEIQYIEPIPGLDIPSNRIVRAEKTETELDVSFTFTADGHVLDVPQGR
jgi:outer membrane biosynthesis protein TonB